MSLGTDDVIRRGAAAGIVIKPSDVSTARWKMRQDEQALVKLPKRNGASKEATPALADIPAVGVLNEDGFMLHDLAATEKRYSKLEDGQLAQQWERFVLRIGTAHARAIVDAVEAKYSNLI